MLETFRIAAVQAAPVFLDREATVAKACALIAEAGRGGAALAAFPEAFIPSYPFWVWYVPPIKTATLRPLYAELVAQSLAVPGPETARLCDAARRAGVAVTIGINERNIEGSGTSLYNSQLYIGADGTVLGRHRKLIPTAAERLVWAQGDGSDLAVYPQPFGVLGGLICWENYMPLARYALYAWGIEIYVAPTWDRGEPWLSTLRHVAKEGRCVVIGCCSAVHARDVPDRYAFKSEYLGDTAWVNPGGSVLLDPDGKLLAGPAHEQETILYADIRREQMIGPRFQLDAAGHYARPDVFELRVHRKPRPFIQWADDEGPSAAPTAEGDGNPRATRLFEASLYATDLDAAEQFYTGVMGLSVASRAGTRGIAFRCGSTVLLVFDPDATGEDHQQAPPHGAVGQGHVAFAVASGDLPRWREHFRRNGVAIERELDWNEGRSLYVRDPAGNSVELAPPTLWGMPP